MLQQQLRRLLVAVVFLGATFSAKPMYQQTFSVLEKTASYISEFAPEIASVGGSLLIFPEVTKDRSDNNFMEPQTEMVKYDSNGRPGSNEVVLGRSILDSSILAGQESKKNGNCELF